MNNFTNNSLAGIRPQFRNGKKIVALRLLVLFFAALIYGMLSANLIVDSQGFIAYTSLLLGYLFLELKNLWKYDSNLFWINPIFLASIQTFILAFGVSNVIYFFPDAVLEVVGIVPNVTPWMNQLMLFVLLGAISMWVGYSSSIGFGLSRLLQRSRFIRSSIKPYLRLNYLSFFVCILISGIGWFWSNKLGINGYASISENLIQAAPYTQYFYLLDLIGKLSFFCIAMKCFSLTNSNPADKFLLFFLLIFQVVIGIVSGFKSSVIYPFIYLGMAFYVQRGYISRYILPIVLISLFVAYAVIEPFRSIINEDERNKSAGLSSLIATLSYSQSKNVQMDHNGGIADTTIKILARVNLAYVGSKGLEYKAYNSNLPADSPQFLSNIFLAPFYAVIPKFLWKTKPLAQEGLWYSTEVLGNTFANSIGMSPFTYLNFAGGPLAIMLGFLMVGIMQRGIFDGLRNFGFGALIILFGLLNILGNIDSAFYSFFLNIVRYGPIFIFIQYFLLRRSGR
jgi:hypothetical protein